RIPARRGAAACAAGMLATSTTVTAEAIATTSVVPRRMNRFITTTFSVPSAVASRRHPYGTLYRSGRMGLIGEKPLDSRVSLHITGSDRDIDHVMPLKFPQGASKVLPFEATPPQGASS